MPDATYRWYCAEVYTRNKETGESGWDIIFVWVHSPGAASARARVELETPDFGDIIKIDEYSAVEGLSGCIALVLPRLAPGA